MTKAHRNDLTYVHTCAHLHAMDAKLWIRTDSQQHTDKHTHTHTHTYAYNTSPEPHLDILSFCHELEFDTDEKMCVRLSISSNSL